MRSEFFFLLIFLAGAVLYTSLPVSAVYITSYFPDEIWIDVGEQVRYLQSNPSAVLIDPSFQLNFRFVNKSSFPVEICVNISTTDTSIIPSSYSATYSLGSATAQLVGVNFEANVVEGNQVLFTNKKVVPLSIDINVVDSCTTPTVVYNSYSREINVVFVNSAEPGWTLVYERNGEDLTGVSGFAQTSATECPGISPCYYVNYQKADSLGDYIMQFNTYDGLFSGINTSGYTECVASVKTRIVEASYYVAYTFMSVYLEPPLNTSTDPFNIETSSYTFTGSETNIVLSTFYVTPNQPDVNMYFTVTGYLNDVTATTSTLYVDDLRVYCR